MIQSARPERLRELTVQRLLTHIRDVKLQPGERLPTERALAGQLGISRNVLREAFRLLEDWGLIQSRRGSGRYLREIPTGLPPNPLAARRLEVASIADVLESRLWLEEHVITLACQRRTLAEAWEIVRLAHHLDAAEWHDNVEFHVAIARATHNFMLERMLREHLGLLSELRQRDHYEERDAAQWLLGEHRDLANAVFGRDEIRGRALVASHLAHTKRSVGVTDAEAPSTAVRGSRAG